MNEITSRDGTRIAFERTGDGPPLILAVGAFNDRTKGAPLARALVHRFSVCTYDRRGHGDSADAPAYEIEREVEDLAALISELGGSAAVFGYSSGAALALRAAGSGLRITRLALYDLPPAQTADHVEKLRELVASGLRGDAVAYFQQQLVGIPQHIVAQLRQAPFWPALEAIAHTLVYDATLMAYGDPSELARNVAQPTLAMAGAASHPAMREVAEALARALPHAQAVTLEGQTHELEPAVLAPLIERFLTEG